MLFFASFLLAEVLRRRRIPAEIIARENKRGLWRGQFVIPALPRKNFELHITSIRSLASNVNVNASTGSVSGVTAPLYPGDTNGDNSVEVLDLDLLIQFFDREGEP